MITPNRTTVSDRLAPITPDDAAPGSNPPNPAAPAPTISVRRLIGEYTTVLARAVQHRFPEIDDAWIDRIRLASMLHDIGKVGVPDAVLRKPGKLTDQEFEVIKQHPGIGADTLVKVSLETDDDPLIKMATDIALYHHEKWDGSGYPTATAGRDIPLAARVTAVADVFDALMSPRCYKPAMPLEKVREIIVSSSGSHFDPDLVQAFLQTIDELRDIHQANADATLAQAA